jgi:23S rRNA (uracil1939-C5)-methyltransferase
VRECPLLVNPLNTLLNSIAGRKVSLPRTIKDLSAIAGDDGAVASSPVIAGTTADKVTISAGNKVFEVSGSGFFQGNRPLLERLGSWAHAKAGGGRCVDLYGGSGFFSVMLADRFKEGLLIESESREAATAATNFKRNGIAHFSAIQGTAEHLTSYAGTKPVDCLIVDPPRPGLTKEVRTAIAALKPLTILYVSCNPSTQARDAGYFVNQEGYSISAAALFDLYPNTHHIETILVLEKDRINYP